MTFSLLFFHFPSIFNICKSYLFSSLAELLLLCTTGNTKILSTMSLTVGNISLISRGRCKILRLLKSGGYQFFSTRGMSEARNQHFYPFSPFFMNCTLFKDPISFCRCLILCQIFVLKETIDVVYQNFTNFL